MPTRLAEHAPYWLPENPSLHPGDGYTVIGCGDDRWQWGGLQFFGGNYGLAVVRAGAMEVQKPGSYTEAKSGISANPVHVLAGIIHQSLLKEGHVAVDHDNCAAAGGADVIAQTGVNVTGTPEGAVIAEKARQKILAIAQIISGISEDRFDEVLNALASVGGQTKPYGAVQEQVEPRGPDKWQLDNGGLLVPVEGGVPRVPLSKPKHEADLVAVTNDSGHRFDSMVAWEMGDRAYHVSMGFLPALNALLNRYLGPVRLQHAEDVTAVFTAQTVVNLPLPGTDQKLGPDNVQYLPRVEYAQAA